MEYMWKVCRSPCSYVGTVERTSFQHRCIKRHHVSHRRNVGAVQRHLVVAQRQRSHGKWVSNRHRPRTCARVVVRPRPAAGVIARASVAPIHCDLTRDS